MTSVSGPSDKSTRQQRRRAARRQSRDTFTSAWRNLGDRLRGKDRYTGEIFTFDLDDHMAVVVVLMHKGCAHSHAATHLLEAAETWVVEHGDFTRPDEIEGGA